MEILVDESLRLDMFLSNKLNKTRSYIKSLNDKGNILVNNKKVKNGYTTKIGDVINLEIVTEVTDIVASNIKVDIIYEDDDIIIVNKEKGMVVHPGNGNRENTLVNSLLYTHKDKLSSINDVIRPGIVHRIDKDTSGILVVAKNDKAHKFLSEQFKKHSINREYIALVLGIIKEDEITIDKPIGRSLVDRKKMSVNSKKTRNAVTHISVLNRFYNSNLTLIKAKLETGRTHQIRVHMKYLNHPLVGDKVYGKGNKNIDGQMLHAHLLGFIHPTTNKYVEFKVDYPNYFKDIIKKIENKENSIS